MGLFQRSKERTEKLIRKADQLEMDFWREEPFDIKPLLQDFALFRRGYRKRITNVMRKQSELNETDMRIFDYRFTIGAGNNSRTFKQSVFFVQAKQLGLPHLWMRPERFLNRIGAYLGIYKDIDFESFPKFSDQYLLQGEDEDLVRYIMSNELLHFFSIEKGWYLESINYFFILYKQGTLFSPSDIEEFYKTSLELYDLLQQSNDRFLE